MRREIKFRALRKDDKGWSYGDFWVYDGGDAFIHEVNYIPPTWHEPGGDVENIDVPVKSSSLGQFTGEKDLNGDEIYEGDLLRIYLQNFTHRDKTYRTGEVQFHSGGFKVRFFHPQHGQVWTPLFDLIRDNPRPIIGNIHENPELAPADKCVLLETPQP